MNISMRKISAIADLKIKLICRNMHFLVYPLMAIGLTFLYKIQIPSDAPIKLVAAMFGMEIGTSFTMVGMPLVALMIAEEKEKNTLRALMTSSVTGTDYLLGTIIIPFILNIAVIFIFPLILNFPYDMINIPMLLLVSALGTFSGVIIGFAVGVFSKTQNQASIASLPIMLGLMLIPMLGNMIPIFAKISPYTISGVMSEYVIGMADKINYILPIKEWIVLGAWIIIPLIFAIIGYKKSELDY